MADESDLHSPGRPNRLTLTAFALVVVLLAANPLAVKYTDLALPPFWGGATRMFGASVVFFAYTAVRRVALPRGRDLLGVVFYGFLQFGLGFGLGYWALTKVPANIAGVVLASIPLFTLAIAASTRTEPLTLRGAAGSLIAIAGIAILLDAHSAATVPWPYMAAMIGFSVCLAAGLVVAKRLRQVHPAAINAVGMLVGAILLLAAAFVTGEAKPLPQATTVWAVQLYVVLFGSVAAFGLMLYVLKRWTASATSYQTVLSPPVTIMLAALLLAEPVSGGLVLGTAVVLMGVYVGVLWHPRHGVAPPARTLSPR